MPRKYLRTERTLEQELRCETAGPYAFHYDYVPAGISNMKYPSGRQVATTYNQASQPNGLTGYASNFQYAPHGALQQLQLGNGVKETWTYNSRLQPTAISAVNANTSANLLTLGYGYSSGAGANGGATNNVGNVLNQTITPGASSSIYQSYAYDHFDRLTVAAEYASSNSTPACPDGSAVWCQQFSPGTYGNVLTTSVNLGIQSPAGFDANNHNSPHYGLEISTSCSASNSGWCYDNAGNLTRDSSNQTFGYSADGQMVAVCPSQSNPSLCTNQWNTGQVVYTYDAEGKRVQSQLADGTEVVYVYDATGRLAAEYGGTNTNTGTQYLTADPLGSTRMVSASVSGSPCATARMDFLPYGFVVPSSFSNRTNLSDCGAYTYQRDGGVRQKFAGSEHDSESGLEFFRARHVASTQGRFTSPDPLVWQTWNGGPSEARAAFQEWISDPQNLNLYSYVRNNPLKYTDPLGLSYQICDANGQNCTAKKEELNDAEFEAERKKAQASGEYFRGGKFYHYDSNGNKAVDGTYRHTDVDLDAKGQSFFSDNRDLWRNSAGAVNTAAVATAAVVAAPVIADAVMSLPTMQVAVGPGEPYGIHFAFEANGTWLHAIRNIEGAMEVTPDVAAAYASRLAWFKFAVPVLSPGAVAATAGTATANCFTGVCTAFLKGWGF